MDLTESIIPKSDQLNAEDLLSGPRTFTIDEVRAGSAEQPVDVHLVEFPGRPFKPSKTVRRILVAAWGPDASAYAGRRMTLYRDPTVKFGGMDVGGLRISHLSHMDRPMTLALTVTRGKRAAYVVQPLREDPAQAESPTSRALVAFAGVGVSLQQLTDRIGRPPQAWTPGDLASLEGLFTSIRRGETTAAEQFPGQRATVEEVRRAAVPDPPPAAEEVAGPAPDAAERRQIQRLQILLRGAGMGERDGRLAWVEKQIGRRVESTNELTTGEAAMCIALAEKLPVAATEATS